MDKLKMQLNVKPIIFSLLVLLMSVQISVAQEIPTQEELDAAALERQAEIEFNNVEFRGNNYKRANFKTMSHLYWRFGLPSTENTGHVDEFFKINECELYERYRRDEFEWTPLRDAMTEYLHKNRAGFSNRIFLDFPIEVGEYNIQKQNFSVASQNFSSATRDIFPFAKAMGWNIAYCNRNSFDKSHHDVYPRDIVFRFIRPITISTLRIEEAKAKKLVFDWKKSPLPNRVLTIRLFINVNKFVGRKDYANENNIPVFLSRLDGYEVYKDNTMQDLLSVKSYIRKKKKAP